MDVSKIDAVVEAFTEGTDLFLVEVKVSPANEIEVVIDSDSAVSIDQCAALSRAIEAAFDREVEDFELSVFSAGVGQPLKLARQYRNAIGKPVDVVMKDGMKYAGKLEAFDGEAVTVAGETFPLAEIKAVRLQVLFR